MSGSVEQSVGTFHHAIALDDLWEGDMVGVEVAGQPVVLVHLRGTVRAYRDRCPHQDSVLSEGDLDGDVLTCARHLWTFDVTTGQGINPRRCHLTEHAVRIVDGAVEVRLEA